jgi:phosphoribosyl 1,2-cyclic phosphate phosphodiesterase
LTLEALKREFSYIFSDKKYPGVPAVKLHVLDSKPFLVGDIPITPILVRHLQMPVLGFRFGKFTYITDANSIDDIGKQKIIGSDTLVINALRKKPHISHFNLEQAIGMVQEIEIPNAYFTHISHQLGLHEEVNKELPSQMQLAWDGLIVKF